jgi:hypothetical protein
VAIGNMNNQMLPGPKNIFQAIMAGALQFAETGAV